MRKKKDISILLVCGLFVAFLTFGILPHQARAFEYDSATTNFALHGYLFQRVSVNTEDPVETEQDDQWNMSMLRSTAYIDATLSFDALPWISFGAIGEWSYEHMTTYLQRLDELSTADLRREYNKDKHGNLREGYADIYLGDRQYFRLGRQQVAWGNTDFFKAMDLIHGNDYTWRSFLEGDAELVRKPLILVNSITQFPEVNGSLQVIVRPGLDRNRDIGNTYELRGGRWASQPNKGVDFLGVEGFDIPYNYDFEDGDADDPNYGIRWTGMSRGIEYSLSYLHTLNLDPVVNSSLAPYKEMPDDNKFAEFIYPEIDLVGFTANYYNEKLDTVFRTEVAYIWDTPYNVGRFFGGGSLPGFGGVKEKDTVRWMVNFDRNISWFADLVRSYRPAFLSVQLFDTWVVNHDDDDDLVYTAGYSAPVKEHSFLFTAILSWNYMLDDVSPSLVYGYDLTNGGGMFIPGIKFTKGDHWRLIVEYDMFWDKDSKSSGEIEDGTTIFGYFHNNDQLYARLTYQF